MGKAYAGELESLADTFEWAAGMPINRISAFVRQAGGLPLYAVGSGGSRSAAVFASILHRQVGMPSVCLTPLELLEIDAIDCPCAILMVTAGGNNPDILAAFDKALSIKPELLGVLCASTGNKLTREAQTHPRVVVHAATPPTGKDGFLATNTLLATEVWLARAYANAFSSIEDMPHSSDLLLYDGLGQAEFEQKMQDTLRGFEEKQTVIALHDGWGSAAATDAESKLSEAGLVNAQLSDYRNFAHGRHNWLDKNKHSTGVIALVTPRCSNIASKTIGLIPDDVTVARLVSSFDGPAASLSLLVKVMHTVKFFGVARQIDPGRPRVARFGSRMYHLRMSRVNRGVSERECIILARKCPSAKGSSAISKLNSLRRFVRRVEGAKFSGVVFDYDGTICDPENRHRGASPEIIKYAIQMLKSKISVGVATGRGASVREDLQRAVPKKYWRRLLIGYHNGASTGYLDDDSVPDDDAPMNAHLKALRLLIQRQGKNLTDCNISERPHQISIRFPKMSAADLATIIGLDDRTDSGVRIVESGHSVDIIPADVTKINILAGMRTEMTHDDPQILCIGDRGKWPGNDFEMLKTRYSLSVDEVSDDPDSCWNTLPPNVRGEAGTLEYLRGAEIYDKYFMLYLGVR
ncbi:MAG: hypothetical protein OYG31_02685 [Candidatus Kaiserbacteria bacterium]|nr:hypothetical protein [Candidatus Kaiserbacteria bacterium]